jgi:hypothetical protein
MNGFLGNLFRHDQLKAGRNIPLPKRAHLIYCSF